MSRRLPPEDRNDPGAGEPLVRELLPPLDDRPGPARPLTLGRNAATARAIVAAALAEPVAPATRAETATRWRYRALAFAAAVLLGLSAAVAPALVRYARQLAGSRAPATPALPPAPRPAPSGEGSRSPPPAAVPPRAIEPATRPSPPRARLAAQSPAVPAATPEVDVEQAPPEDLLSLANERRREQDWSGADQFYRAVIRRFPGSDAAVVAGVASAALHLEQLGDTAGALRGYRQALAARPAGPLAEEARWGIAEAQRALGDPAAEAEALGDFLARHPGSALAPAARRRQAELAR